MLKLQARTETAPLKVAIVERYALVRAAIRDLLAGESDIVITAAEPTVQVLLQATRDDPVDAVLVHASLAGQELVAAIQQLKRECPTTAVVILGSRRDDNELFWALQSGAAGHVADATNGPELAATLRAVAAGTYLIDREVAARPVLARRVLDAFREATQASAAAREAEVQERALVRLTRRETEILTAISRGMTNKQIAAELSISQHTVNNAVKSVLRKLAVNNRTRAVLLALRESWIPVPTTPVAPMH
jgi:DNA-binding NarL/FixJ family response regulator